MSEEKLLKIFRSYITPILFVLLLSVSIGTFFGWFGRQSIRAVVPNIGGDWISNLLFSLIVVGIGLSASVLIYFFSSRGKGLAANFMVVVTLVPFLVIFLLFFGQALVLAFLHQVSGPISALLSIGSIYLAVFSAILLMGYGFSARGRNLIFLLYGGIIGAFSGLIIPTVPLLLMLAAISVYDWLLIRESRIPAIAKEEKSRVGPLKFYYESEEIEMGIGEFIAFSMLPAHTFFYFDFLTCIVVLTLILIASIINFAILIRTRMLAGVPIPMLMLLSFMSLRLLAAFPA